MSVGYDIRALLTSAGITAQVNNVDDSLQNTIAVMETSGFQPIRCHSATQEALTIDRPSFQIIVRNSSKPVANTLIEQIIATLDGIAGQEINGEQYISVLMASSPMYLGRVQTQAGETNEYSINFDTQKIR